MTDQNRAEDRDEVLFAFHRACNDPTAEQIIEWTSRFPQFADDIRTHAALLKDWAAREGLPAEEPDETMLARGRSRALDALYNAEVALTSEETSASPRSFEQMMYACGKDVPQLARDLDIARGILAALVGGRMLAPVGGRLVTALMAALAITHDAFNDALQSALAAPRIGHAKANGAPTVIAQSYEALIRSSSMTDEQKQHWLSED
jgi:hypothetical protein